MSDKTKKKIEGLRKAYQKFEKRMNELKDEEHEIVSETLKKIEQLEIKDELKKLDQIKD